jgi:Glycosyltransferase family 87
MRAAILFALLACLAAVAFASRIRHEMVDFEVYRTAGARVAAGESLYRVSDEHYQFKYFPASAFLFTPFAALPDSAARALWFALSVALLVGMVTLSLRQLPSRAVPVPIIVVGTILTLAKFYAHELTLGQANLLFGVVAVAALAQLQRGRDAGGGATFGAAALVKPYGLLFLPYLIATGRFRAAGTCAAVLILGLACPVITYGVDGNARLLGSWREVVTGSTLVNLTNQDNVSIAAMYVKWLGHGSTAYWLTILTSFALVGVCAAVIAMRRRLAAPDYLEVALLLTAVTLLSPQGWDYVLLLSTPAVVLLINALPQFNRPLQSATIVCLALIGLTIYDVMGRAAYARFMALSIITVAYGFLIAMLVYMRAKQLH